MTAAMSEARPVGAAIGASGRTSMRWGEAKSLAASRLRNRRIMPMPRVALQKPFRRPEHAVQLADPARFELTTSAFGGQRSIQLSYGSGARNIAERPRRRNARPSGAVDRKAPVP